MTPFAFVQPFFFAVAIVMAMLVIIVFSVATFLFRPWLQAYLSGTPISIISIMGMRMRRTPIKPVLDSLIMAKQAGVSISCSEMESAYLQGVDLERVTLAMIHAQREGQKFQFQELVEADLEQRLDEKLDR